MPINLPRRPRGSPHHRPPRDMVDKMVKDMALVQRIHIIDLLNTNCRLHHIRKARWKLIEQIVQSGPWSIRGIAMVLGICPATVMYVVNKTYRTRKRISNHTFIKRRSLERAAKRELRSQP